MLYFGEFGLFLNGIGVDVDLVGFDFGEFFG